MATKDLDFEDDQPSVEYEGSRYDKLAKWVAHGILIVMSAIMTIPFLWAFLTSLKPENKIFTTIHQIIPSHPTFANYVNVWLQNPLDRWVLNSLVLTVGVVFFTLLLDTLAGYALAKGDFKGKSFVYTLVIGTLVIPPQVVLVPLYLEMNALNWSNTYWAIIVLYVANPFGTFMMRQFFLGVPDSLIEAARMDGCSTIQIYTRVMLPLAKPALSSLGVFTFIFVWGAFLWPLVILNDSAMYPLQVGIGLLTGKYSSQWGQLLAAVVLAALPVIAAYLLAQRTFMEGIALTGGKG
ncbi:MULTISPECIES: carbohydrate ABC transporter permease [unclassified Haladaptatus]|uniref:carbohydrate ABC transporter permease n=1 Tax=unclassified Haladaptatus TaxID=2622732 RepID=UPI00209C3430|nr:MULTISPECIES: carbohydrate ABC transporter permease [unclassified Haladaptatus]MCO8243693.1 carbohydrate ABC transporter permease [Haladaptatus sp. AB643]MCO8255102.1 carbohydrate ABC transporter permease [Haladaptatus sp. AB618]